MGSQRFHRVYVRNSPRAIALCPTQGQQRDRPDSLPLVLVVSLHQPSREALGPDTGLRASLPDLTTVTVQLEPPAVLRDFVPVAQDAVYGCIGLIYHERDVYMALITDCSFVCRILPHEPVYSLQRVAFLSLTTSRYDDWTRFDSLPSEYDEPTTGPGPRSTSLYGTHPCHTLAQYLASSSFYFSPNADLTRNLQSRHTDSLSREAEFPYNRKYLWNTFMLQPFLKFRHHLDSRLQQAFDEFGVLIPLIQGYATSHLLPHLTRGHGQLTLISRRSSGRAGARFLTRGLDDAGNVANEVETEVTCLLDDQCFSVVILRGSVPVFWEQSGVQLTEHKVQLTRSAEATEPAFQLHLQDLLQRYRRVHVVDLLKERDNSAESVLSQAYQHQIVQTQLPQLIHYTPFDYSAVCRGDNVEAIQLLVKHVLGDLQDYGYFSLRLTDLTVQSHQRGIFRVNCLDCLDRTNVAQNALSWAVFRYYLKDRLKATDLDTLLYVQQIHTQAWVQNGDTLSHQYAGTGALRSNMTRSTKSTWSGMFQDMTKSISRLYQGKMKDPSKQHVMDTLLGKRAESRKIRVYLDSLVALRQQLQRHEAQFLRRHQLTLFVTTFNAGGADPHAGFLNKWLKHAQVSQLPDIFAFGFQEIVDLNVYELMSASSNKPMSWEYRILQELKALSLDGSPNQEPVDYVTLTSEHL
ncbi:Inositol-1,4,5-trisphosphate 5-phosphatase 1, partial [Dimargaris verticillata]